MIMGPISYCNRYRTVAFLTVMGLACHISSFAQTVHPPAVALPDLRALIVGVASTPRLLSLPRLEGVANDVKVMRHLALTLGVHPNNITLLSDTESGSVSPTLGAIQNSLRILEETATANTQLLLYLSGHGAQQPIKTNAKAAGNEFDGLDEIFLTADAQPFSVADRTTPGALTDNMLAEVLQSLAGKGVHIWLIVDSCNAGTMTRGAHDNEADANFFAVVGKRGASPDAIGVPLTITWQSLAARGKRLQRRLSTLFPSAEKQQTIASQWPNVTAFYATGESGEAVDVRLNRESQSKTAEAYGLFTYLLTNEANRLLSAPGSAPVLSYRLLMQRVLTRYRQNAPKSAPLPTFEGVNTTSWFGKSTMAAPPQTR
jgi:hypothetical protein